MEVGQGRLASRGGNIKAETQGLRKLDIPKRRDKHCGQREQPEPRGMPQNVRHTPHCQRGQNPVREKPEGSHAGM